MGYEFWPQSLEVAIRYAAETAQMPLYVTENGLGHDDDTRRIAYVHEALEGVGRCLADGIDVRGYFYWSLLDNFEWALGYGPRFGLVSVTRDTFVRTPEAVGRLARRHRPRQPARLNPAHVALGPRFSRSKPTLIRASHALTLFADAGWDDGVAMERGTILVVDDEPNIADLVELYLRRDGYRVVKAATGEEVGRRGRAPTGPGSSCSTSASPTSTASRCAAACARPRRSR